MKKPLQSGIKRSHPLRLRENKRLLDKLKISLLNELKASKNRRIVLRDGQGKTAAVAISIGEYQLLRAAADLASNRALLNEVLKRNARFQDGEYEDEDILDIEDIFKDTGHSERIENDLAHTDLVHS